MYNYNSKGEGTKQSKCKKCVDARRKFLAKIPAQSTPRYSTEKYIELAMKKHGDKYIYDKVVYKGGRNSVDIYCKQHKKYFSISASSHLFGKGCQKCSQEERKKAIKIRDEELFFKKANSIHADKYDYSKSEYINSATNIEIICKIHSSFYQRPNHHIQGHGCSKCGHERSNYGVWSTSQWEEEGLKSKKFDSFKIYIINCWGNGEEFYKIGKTYTSVGDRFRCKTFLPYNYKIIEVIEGDAHYISELENKLQKENKKHKYIPYLNFSGATECFSKIEFINHI